MSASVTGEPVTPLVVIEVETIAALHRWDITPANAVEWIRMYTTARPDAVMTVAAAGGLFSCRWGEVRSMRLTMPNRT